MYVHTGMNNKTFATATNRKWSCSEMYKIFQNFHIVMKILLFYDYNVFKIRSLRFYDEGFDESKVTISKVNKFDVKFCTKWEQNSFDKYTIFLSICEYAIDKRIKINESTKIVFF